MKAIIDPYSPDLVVQLVHGDKKLFFGIATIGRDNFKNGKDPFLFLNKYWETLSDKDQSNIFSIYEKIEFCFSNTLSNKVLEGELIDLFGELSKYHRLDKILYWVKTRSGIIYPPGLEESYIHNIEKNTSREKTYLRDEYIELVAMTLAVRVYIPVISKYISCIYRQASARLKEYLAFPLLEKTDLHNSVPMNKLAAYIEAILQRAKINPSNILNGLSREDIPRWFLALTVIRKLSVASISISEDDPKSQLAAVIHHFILTKAGGNESNFSEMVKDKKFEPPGESSGSDKKMSNPEAYRVATELSPGTVSEMKVFIKHPHELIARFNPSYNKEKLDRDLLLMSKNKNPINEVQVILLAHVLGRVIPPDGFWYMKPNILKPASVVAQTILWEKGFRYLAVLSTAHEQYDNGIMEVNSIETKGHIPKNILEKLDEIYPYNRPVNARKLKASKQSNDGVQAIDYWVEKLSALSWRATCHDEYLEEIFGNKNRKISISSNVREEFAKLLIAIYNGEFL